MYRLPLRKVEFGVEPDRPNAHTIRGELFAPSARAASLNRRSIAAGEWCRCRHWSRGRP